MERLQLVSRHRHLRGWGNFRKIPLPSNCTAALLCVVFVKEQLEVQTSFGPTQYGAKNFERLNKVRA